VPAVGVGPETARASTTASDAANDFSGLPGGAHEQARAVAVGSDTAARRRRRLNLKTADMRDPLLDADDLPII
jgi:hypothetical protein